MTTGCRLSQNGDRAKAVRDQMLPATRAIFSYSKKMPVNVAKTLC
jgi:hypothetical protein